MLGIVQSDHPEPTAAQSEIQLPLRWRCGDKNPFLFFLCGCHTCCHTSTPAGITHPSWCSCFPSDSRSVFSGQSVDQPWSSIPSIPSIQGTVSSCTCSLSSSLHLLLPCFLVLQALWDFYLNVFPSIVWFCVCVPVHACVFPCSQNPVFPMPSALYGFLFLSDCTDGSYRDGSHAPRWEHSALDHGLKPCHPTYTHTYTHTTINYMYKHTLKRPHAHRRQ